MNDAINNHLMVTSIDKPGKEHWKEIIPYDSTRKIDEVEVFKNFIVIQGRQDGLTQIWTMGLNEDSTVNPQSFKKIQFKEMYECAISTNKVYDTNFIRTYYSSLTTPDQWEDYNFNDGTFKLVKQKECLNFDSSLYVCKRLFAKANDGTQIPMSMVHRKTTKVDGWYITMLYI